MNKQLWFADESAKDKAKEKKKKAKKAAKKRRKPAKKGWKASNYRLGLINFHAFHLLKYRNFPA